MPNEPPISPPSASTSTYASLSTTKHTPTPKLGPYKPTLILHGGAGAITRASLPPALYAQYHASLQSYLISTATQLHSGSNAVAAACHAVTLMEDDPLFNCGRGSVFTSVGEIEMEASIAVTSLSEETEFEGKVKRCAAVSMLSSTRHPILLAREVLSMGDADAGLGGVGTMHGHLSGQWVEEWGWKCRELERKSKEWFWTKRRWEEHLRGLKRDGCSPDHEKHDSREVCDGDEFVGLDDVLVLPSQGTVGAVCMDSWGVIAVATSTGGLTNKKPGRIGDTPSVGAGFWAETWAEEMRQEVRLNGIGGARAGLIEQSTSERIASVVRSEVDFWLGDCLPMRRSQGELDERSSSSSSATVEKEPLLITDDMVTSSKPTTKRRAIAMSGTGNGDSFLRTNACRTAAAISRFSRQPLSKALHAVAGPAGELQRSAGDRWGRTGEGEGGIIGIELVEDEKKEGKVIFDFNCEGLWRAYFQTNADGKQEPKVMVFREEY